MRHTSRGPDRGIAFAACPWSGEGPTRSRGTGGPATARHGANGHPTPRGRGRCREPACPAGAPDLQRRVIGKPTGIRQPRMRACRENSRRFRSGPGALRHADRRAMRIDEHPETQKSWRRPIFPKGCPLSIFGAGELNFRVRDGNGCGLSARVTRISCVWTVRQRAGVRGSARGANLKIFDLE